MTEGQRRLSAIAFTDMVGYTSLAQRDESLALQLLDKHNALVRSVAKQHQGREVKTIGDAFLFEFDSALEAVLCSVRIQSSLRERNRSAAPDEKILVRIGIHVGDVIHLGGDILGDAVNIASRIVNFAENGGICISEQVYAQVMNKVQVPLVKMPGQKLKNVDQQLDLYQVVLPWDQSGPPKPSPRSRIAILPFRNISPDSGDAYFADGLTEELISTLSEVKGLRVIARTSVNRYKDTNKSVSQIGSELQVAFILDGSVRKAGNRIRVTAQLIDTESQEQAWSNSYDRDLDDVFSIQSDIARQVVGSLKVALLSWERERVDKKDTENVAAFVAYLKGRALLHDRTEKAIIGAKEQFELAIREDPTYAKAYSGLADTNMLLGDYLFEPVPTSLQEARMNIKRALELDPDLPEARISLGNSLMYDYRFEESEREFKRGLALNPSYATAHHWYATLLAQFGKFDEAYSEVTLAEGLDPLSSAITLSAIYRCIAAGKFDEVEKRIKKLKEIDPSSPLVTEGLMAYHFAKQDWESALVYLDKMMKADPSDPFLDMDLAYIYAVTGRREKTLKLLEKLKQVPDRFLIKGQLLAFAYSGLNDLDECFRWCQFALESKEIFIGWFRGYPLLANVRSDPRFAELLKRTGLPP